MVVAFLIPIGALLRGRQKTGEKVVWTIPWSSIKSAKVEEGLAQIVVKKFNLKGGLYFQVRGDVNVLVDAVAKRAAA